MASHKPLPTPLQAPPSPLDPHSFADRAQQELLGHCSTSILVLLARRKDESETTQVIDEEIRHSLSLIPSHECAPYEVRTAVVLRDQCLRELLARYNPAIVITTGPHFMRLMLGGCAGSPSQYLQSLQSLHGQLIPAHQDWGSRMVYPLEDCDATAVSTRKRDSGDGQPKPPQPQQSPCNAEERKCSIRNDLRSLFAHLREAFASSPRQQAAAARAGAFPMLWSSAIEAALTV